MRKARIAAFLACMLPALPITCAQQSGNDLYTGGLTASPGGRINPAEPNFVNGGGSGGGGR